MLKAADAINGQDGFSTNFGFTENELYKVRELIKSQWLSRIEDFQRGLGKKFETIEMDQYHELAYLIPHEKMWPKSKRILGTDACDIIRQTSLVKSLETEFGSLTISGEDGIEKEEIYWRLVRPISVNDVGPLHADGWFWTLNNWLTPPNHKRLKVWISIYSEPGKNGFKFVRGSHKKEWKYHGEFRDGYVKPVLDEDDSKMECEIFEGVPGRAILFNDNLLHGGVSGGSTTRVSLEFTIFVKED
jgi:hypothetical protein